MLSAKRGSTKRVQKLLNQMEEHAWQDRSDEWLTPDMFEDISEKYVHESVIMRRARAVREMLVAMADSNNSRKTRTYEIREGEPIVGVIALGSLGLGKAFPNYITEDEKRVASITSKTEMALFGHNSVNYTRLMSQGVKGIVKECEEHLFSMESQINMYESLAESIKHAQEKPSLETQELHAANTVLLGQLDKQDKQSGRRIAEYEKEIGSLFRALAEGKNEFDREIRASHLARKLQRKQNLLHDKVDFYTAVQITCMAVVEYAKKYAELAEKMAVECSDPTRKEELKEIARICRKVPWNPPETFHEALQSIFFYHLALHSSMNQLSLGRLDQILQPFYRDDEKEKQQELFECFLIKCAERLIFDERTFVKQDHIDFASSLLTSPISLDQWAEANEFLQNIIIGGLTRSGEDATNETSYLILDAYKSTRLYTPTLNARIHRFHRVKGNPFLPAIAECLRETANGMPVIGNDEVLVPALAKYSGVPKEEARDYVIDGCWEPLLNGTGDWTFRLMNMLTVMECALNGGATLSAETSLLRGEKLCYKTPEPARDSSIDFDGIKEIMARQIRFFTDQAALSIYKLYLIDQAMNPTPLFSALLAGCMEKGRDRTWGGADYRLAGIIAAGVPDTANTLAAIEKWVYGDPEKDGQQFRMQHVLDAFRYGYDAGGDEITQKIYDHIQEKFTTDSPKFGDNDPNHNALVKWLTDTFYNNIQQSRALAEKVFLKPLPKDPEERRRILSLRALAGYSGPSMETEFGKDFEVKFTASMGTFELFSLMGGGNAASADRMERGAPLARNFAPMAGTSHYTSSHLLSSFSGIGLDRFGGGVITDLVFEEGDVALIEPTLTHFMDNGGNLLSITIASKQELGKIFDTCEKARAGNAAAQEKLHEYRDVNVRVAGYQSPFITLPKLHQEKYIKRPLDAGGTS